MLLIGSYAANLRIPGFRKNPKDIDLVCTFEDFEKYRDRLDNIRACYPINEGKKWVIKTDAAIVEAEIAWPGTTAERLIDIVLDDEETIMYRSGNIDFEIPSIDILYMLKNSHRYLKNSPSFLKTMEDIWKFRDAGATLELIDEDFYKLREAETYNYSHPKLNRNKSEFFAGDGVKYEYDHDSIHQSVKRGLEPAYTYFKDDQKEVWCSEEKFYACSMEIRLNAVLEESLVLALERSQIPFPNMNPDKSFLIALEKVCTSITSGWFRYFAWENYYLVEELYHSNAKDYVKRFWEDVDLNIVKKL